MTIVDFLNLKKISNKETFILIKESNNEKV